MKQKNTSSCGEINIAQIRLYLVYFGSLLMPILIIWQIFTFVLTCTVSLC